MTILDMRKELQGKPQASAFHDAVTKSWNLWNPLATPLWQAFVANHYSLNDYRQTMDLIYDLHIHRCRQIFDSLTSPTSPAILETSKEQTT